MDDNIWSVLLEDLVNFEKGVIFRFERFRMDDDTDAVDSRREERGDFPGWVDSNVEELLGLLVFCGGG